MIKLKKRLIEFLVGYVFVRIVGKNPERFLNICSRRGISIWDIKNNGELTLKTRIKNYSDITEIGKKSGSKVELIYSSGLYSFIKKYKKRKLLIFGFVIFCVSIYFWSSFIWAIDIYGNSVLEKDKIISILGKYGVRTGAIKYGLNLKKIAEQVVLEDERIAWAGIYLKGTRVRVEVKERTMPPQLFPKNIPCDVVALKDGCIESITVTSGISKVKKGDIVKKGEVLISGNVESKNSESGYIQVHASGEIYARTWYEGIAEVEEIFQKRQRTGRMKNIYSIKWNSKNIKFFESNENFQNYDRIIEVQDISFWKLFDFPIEIIREIQFEVQIETVQLQIDEARKMAISKASGLAESEIPELANKVGIFISFINDDNGKEKADVVLECIESIGTEAVINKLSLPNN